MANSIPKKIDPVDFSQAVALRADLLQLVKGLELQRSAILSIVSRIEKDYGIERNKNDRIKTTSGDHQSESGEHSKKEVEVVLQSGAE